MLVLSRKSREAVVIGANVDAEPMLKVTILQILGTSVRLGFEGGKDVLVHRWEVWERIRANGLTDSPEDDKPAAVG